LSLYFFEKILDSTMSLVLFGRFLHSNRVEKENAKEVDRMQALIRCGNQQDLGKLREFLERAGLGTEGLTEETIEYFLLLEDEDGTIKGTLGMETFLGNGMLRSLVVSPGQAEKDIYLLINQMMKLAKDKGLERVFLATNKGGALAFFELLGFQMVNQEELPVPLLESEHIRQVLNVDNSLFLKFAL
jgi:N-acetylglutamate synthase-like GNAT family acetyltransferase